MKADGRIIALSAFLFATIKLPASARPFALFATFLFPHNCGEGAPQLWGSCPAIVGKVHHNCGEATECFQKTKICRLETIISRQILLIVFLHRAEPYRSARRKAGRRTVAYLQLQGL